MKATEPPRVVDKIRSSGASSGRLLGWVLGPRLAWYFSVPAILAVLIMGLAAVFVLTKYVSASVTKDALDEAQRDAEWEARIVATHLSGDQLAVPVTASSYDEFDATLRSYVGHPGVVRIKIWSPAGQILYSDEPSLIGQTFPVGSNLSQALSGQSASEVSDLDPEENAFERSHGRLLEIYTPIWLGDPPQVVAVLETYEDYGYVAGRIQSGQRAIFIAAAVGLPLVLVVLLFVHRWGVAIIGRQRADLIRQADELRQAYSGTLDALGAALDLRDHDTEGHCQRVSYLATAVARELGLSGQELEKARHAAAVHDIGKLAIRDAILSKPGPLTDEEWDEMKRHPELGYEMLKDIPVLGNVADVILCHHERYDGKGYPRGLKGEDIPLAARIFSVVDTYDAMTSDRPYRPAAPHERAMEEIIRCAGTQFDPAVVHAFRAVEKRGLVRRPPASPGGDNRQADEPKMAA